MLSIPISDDQDCRLVHQKPRSKYGIFTTLGRFIVARYPHKIKSTSEVPDAVAVYRKILASQPDNSVTIVTVGFLTNLSNLLNSQPDEFTTYRKELVKRKLSCWFQWPGNFRKERNSTYSLDSTASKNVFENWPGEIIFTGFEIGWEIRTGLLIASGIQTVR